MCKVKVVFRDPRNKDITILCVNWETGSKQYTFWLDTVDKPESKVIVIPIENVLYVEDLLS